MYTKLRKNIVNFAGDIFRLHILKKENKYYTLIHITSIHNCKYYRLIIATL